MIKLFIILCMLGGVLSLRPRGVRAELGSFYNPASDFSCLDGSGTIPFIQVNDDYCDCDDGSDEPGTAACPNGKFFCENKGHTALTIPSSRVNDGICDCCDGSDEWDNGGKCQDVCMELGREAREAAIAAARVAAQGFNIKQSMVEEARRLQEERTQQISEKEQEKATLEASKEEKRQAKEAAEGPEKEALDFYKQLEEEERIKKNEEEEFARNVEAEQMFTALDTNNDGAITIDELQARTGLDTDKDGSVSEEEAKFFLSGNDQLDVDTFKTVAYSLLKPYLDLEQPPQHQEIVTPGPDDEGLDVEMQPPAQPEVYDPWRKNQQQESEDLDDSYDEEDDESEDDEDDYDVNDMPDPDDLDVPASGASVPASAEDRYDEATRKLIEAADFARQQYQEVENRLRDLDRDLTKLKEGMEKDYGDDGEFMVLAGQCFEYTDNEYTYKMCPFDSCSQRNKNGGAETRLGSWHNWVGSNGAKYSKMKFHNGQGCWNGPSRSATVIVRCGTDNILSQVTEPNRCEYEMHFQTPAACHKPEPGLHDEL